VPLQLTAGDRRILLIGAGLFLVMVVATVLVAGGGGNEQEVPTTYSTASGGSRATYLLLKESGYKITTFEQPLRDLPGGNGKTLILAGPIMAASKEDRNRLQAFLDQGGRLIATGAVAAFYVPAGEATPDPFAGIEWKLQQALTPSSLTRAAPEITLPSQAYWNQDTGAVPLYGDREKPVVVKFKVGQGDVLWLAAATPLTNAGLKEKGNLEFLFAAVGEPGSTEILWDEYIHGYERSESPISSSTRIIGWICLQLALFALAILLAYSRRSGPIWMPAAESRLSPLEFVRTLGALYQRANAGSVVVDVCYQRFRYLLTRRLGVAVDAPVDDLDRAIHERWPSVDERVQELGFAESLRECEACRYDPNVPPRQALRLVQTLFDYASRLKLTSIRGKENNAWKRL
jgi:Domain of unknown function (DUF4350)